MSACSTGRTPRGSVSNRCSRPLPPKTKTIELPDELAGKSVALQGLPALEYLLYGDGAEVLAKEREIVGGEESAAARSTPRVPSAAASRSAVATNIDRIAQALVEDWREGSAYEKAFLSPIPEDPIYHAPKEVTLDLFKSFTSGIELVRDQKLAKPLGASPAEARPKLAAFWRSGLSFANAAGNLEGVRTLFAKGGFAQIVAGELAGVENSILFDLDHAIEVLRTIDLPMAEVAADEDVRAKIEALRVALKGAAQTAGDMIAQGAGLAFGFNAMDGD